MAEPKPFTPFQEKVARFVIQPMSKINTWIYRASGGRWGAKFSHGAPVCLLVTTGRKTGEPRTAPLLYLERGDDIVLVASQGGMSKNPAWYLNLEANPDCDIEIGTKTLPMRARRASAEEKAELWPALVAMYPDYDTYQARTDRDIPVLICSPH